MFPPDTFPRISHEEFVLKCENGELGCSVELFSTLRMLATGEIHTQKLRAAFTLWMTLFAVLIISLVIAFLYFPTLWLALGSAILLGAFALVLNHRLSDAVIESAIDAEDFYALAISRQILWVSAEDQQNSPSPGKIAPVRCRRPGCR
jgi:hypothetical protein